MRNLVGSLGRVLLLHWFTRDSGLAMAEMPTLLDFAREQASNPEIEIVLVAGGPSWDRVRDWAREVGAPDRLLYLDPDLGTGRHFGAQRTPETLIYDPAGRHGHQARGPMEWASPAVREQVLALKDGVRDEQRTTRTAGAGIATPLFPFRPGNDEG